MLHQHHTQHPPHDKRTLGDSTDQPNNKTTQINMYKNEKAVATMWTYKKIMIYWCVALFLLKDKWTSMQPTWVKFKIKGSASSGKSGGIRNTGDSSTVPILRLSIGCKEKSRWGTHKSTILTTFKESSATLRGKVYIIGPDQASRFNDTT